MTPSGVCSSQHTTAPPLARRFYGKFPSTFVHLNVPCFALNLVSGPTAHLHFLWQAHRSSSTPTLPALPPSTPLVFFEQIFCCYFRATGPTPPKTAAAAAPTLLPGRPLVRRLPCGGLLPTVEPQPHRLRVCPRSRDLSLLSTFPIPTTHHPFLRCHWLAPVRASQW